MLAFMFVTAKANDGVFYASGNQLIPVTETDISVKKEVLTLNRVDRHIEVTVYYEFYNPTKGKDLIVGFEAPAPYPCEEEYMKLFPEQPHMRNFKVVMNGEQLKYQITHYRGMYNDYINYDEMPYYSNGKVKGMTKKECVESLEENRYFLYTFYFIYYFNAHFEEGLNIIQHTYECDLSSSVGTEFDFDYILTAANRWANNGIDDFTLNIDMGERESFIVSPEFFKGTKDWTINGKGKVTTEPGWDSPEDRSGAFFHIQKGSVTFKQKNFHPDGELYITKTNYLSLLYPDWFDGGVDGQELLDDMKEQYFTLNLIYFEDMDLSKLTAEQKRILKNMPFAYRGHVFKDKGLRQYFESTRWYIPDPDYQDDMSAMSQMEKDWIQFWMK